MFNLKPKKLAAILLSTLILTAFGSISAANASDTMIQCEGGQAITDFEKFSYTAFLKSKVSGLDIQTARTVEISEPLPGEDSSVGNTHLINAYKGACCPSGEVSGTQCKSYVNVYTTKLDDCNDLAYSCKPIQIIVSDSGINLLKFYALQIYIWGASIVGIIAVLTITISGLQIAASGGEEQFTSAKTKIMQSLAGLAILFLSALILYTINPTFFTR
ncbi:MAG: pilin [Patescibacteria group bacterium]